MEQFVIVVVVVVFSFETSQNGVDKLLYNRINIAHKVRNKSANFFDNFSIVCFLFDIFLLFG